MIKRLGLMLCVLLVAAKASAAYVVIENITDTTPPFGSCACLNPYGWMSSIVLDLRVLDADGTWVSYVIASDGAYPRSGITFVLPLSKTRLLAPGASYTSKKILGLPDDGFRFDSRGASVAVYNCAVNVDGCDGYSTGLTSAWQGIDIIPGLGGRDSFDFQVWGPGTDTYSVIRVTFYPGNPPARGKGK